MARGRSWLGRTITALRERSTPEPVAEHIEPPLPRNFITNGAAIEPVQPVTASKLVLKEEVVATERQPEVQVTAPDEVITVLSRGDVITTADDFGYVELRSVVGNSAQGFHGGTEIAENGGDFTARWGEAQASREVAEAEARNITREIEHSHYVRFESSFDDVEEAQPVRSPATKYGAPECNSEIQAPELRR